MRETLPLLSEQKYLHILSLSKDATAIYVNEYLQIGFVNEAMLKIWGKDRSVIGKTFEEAIPEIEGQPFTALLKMVWRTGKTYIAKETPASLIINGILTTSYFDFEYRAIPDENGNIYGLLHTATDVTSRMEASRLLRDKEKREKELKISLLSANEELIAANSALQRTEAGLRLAINTAKMGIWSMDVETGLFDFDERCRNILGVTADEKVDLADLKNIIDKNYQPVVIRTIKEAMKGKSGMVEYSVTNRINSVRSWIRGSAQFIPATALSKARLTGILIDMTAEKDEEERKSDFMGVVSHELRTPLTSLNGFLQILQLKAKKAGDEVMLGLADKARRQADRMASLINGFLDIARLSEDKTVLELDKCNMADIIRSSEQETSVTISSHKLIYEPVPNIVAQANANMIEQVIANFIGNAVKYSPAGSTIRISCIEKDRKVLVTITDEGMGIAPKELPYVFERFYRIQNDHCKSIAGFGIGLYVCKEILDRHKGKIGVESEIGKGSSFWFSLSL